MRKIAAAIARRHGGQIHILRTQGRGFKRIDIVREFILPHAMPVHIQQRRCEQFAHVVAFIKLRRAEHAVAQRGRHDFPGLMVPRIVGKYLRLAGPVFINL